MSFFKREKEMSKIARDLVSVYLYDDLHERFNEVCYCQCNSDKEERKISSEVFQNDGNPNYFYELLSILDDIVECSTCDAIPPHFRDTFKSKDDNFWNHFQTIKTDKEALKTLLNKFVDYLYVIVLFMGGEQQLIDAERKKKGLGYLIHNLHNDDCLMPNMFRCLIPLFDIEMDSNTLKRTRVLLMDEIIVYYYFIIRHTIQLMRIKKRKQHLRYRG